MANNYTQFSVVIYVSGVDERGWIDKYLTEDNVDLEFEWSWEDGDGSLCVFSSEGCDFDHVTDFFQAYLRKFHPDQHINITYAETCSKMRPDEFGGGALHITAKKVVGMSAHQWLDDLDSSAGASDE